MIELNRFGALLTASRAEVQELRDQFHRLHAVRLRRLVEQSLLERIMARIEQSRFEERQHHGIGKELWLSDRNITGTLDFVVNDRQLLTFVEKITKSGPIGCFGGRVYRFVPQTDHYDSWHDDLVEDRLVAMSLNLSQEPYAGGLLQIRQQSTGEIVNEVANTILGDAVLFRIGPDFEHRVTPIEGTKARTAYAGWFGSRPDFFTRLAEARAMPA